MNNRPLSNLILRSRGARSLGATQHAYYHQLKAPLAAIHSSTQPKQQHIQPPPMHAASSQGSEVFRPWDQYNCCSDDEMDDKPEDDFNDDEVWHIRAPNVTKRYLGELLPGTMVFFHGTLGNPSQVPWFFSMVAWGTPPRYHCGRRGRGGRRRGEQRKVARR